VELSSLDPTVAKGILRVLVPVLRKSTTMPVVVHTKERHRVTVDVRLSVDPSRVSFWSALKKQAARAKESTHTTNACDGDTVSATATTTQ
jgi:hypothetical protein